MKSIYEKYTEFHAGFKDMKTSRKNDIIMAVNGKVPKEEAELNGEIESKYYDYLNEEAEAYEKRGGVRPIFELGEIESDDERLDIYNEPV